MPGRPTPRSADRHDLYQRSVQCPEAELDFVERVYRTLRRRPPTKIREDFCGTAYTSCEWVRRRPANVAVALDIHRPTLRWGLEHNAATLTDDQRSRLHLLARDVLRPGRDALVNRCDAILAMNFSYFCFKRRDTLKAYFAAVRACLAPRGVFFLDILGGWESMMATSDRTRQRGGFTYVWDQASFNPIDHDFTCHIHFEFARGGALRRAFTYRWRLWTIPEISDLLVECGFKRPTIYWEGDAPSGRGGNGIFRAQKRGEDCPSFVAYIVAPT